MKKKWMRIFLIFILLVFALGFLLPEQRLIPVAQAGPADWNHDTFWYEPWGVSGVHKGIDIFAPVGRPVLASSAGVVVYQGQLGIGGNVVVVLGPKWRLHYYAHLSEIHVRVGQWLSAAGPLGAVGDTGNARGKPAHLHYSVVTLLPYVWRIDGSTQGMLKMFFLDPGAMLLAG